MRDDDAVDTKDKSLVGWPTSDVKVVADCRGRAGCDGSGGGVAEVGLDGGGLGATGGTYLMLRLRSTAGAVRRHTGISPGLILRLSKLAMQDDSTNYLFL